MPEENRLKTQDKSLLSNTLKLNFSVKIDFQVGGKPKTQSLGIFKFETSEKLNIWRFSKLKQAKNSVVGNFQIVGKPKTQSLGTFKVEINKKLSRRQFSKLKQTKNSVVSNFQAGAGILTQLNNKNRKYLQQKLFLTEDFYEN